MLCLMLLEYYMFTIRYNCYIMSCSHNVARAKKSCLNVVFLFVGMQNCVLVREKHLRE
jgi:5'(3')-deoxyribonucleotidase